MNQSTNPANKEVTEVAGVVPGNPPEFVKSDASVGRPLFLEPGKEGFLTKQFDTLSARLPTGVFLSGAMAAVGFAAYLYRGGRKEEAQFVGHWAPTILLFGLYNKLVKLLGSEGKRD